MAIPSDISSFRSDTNLTLVYRAAQCAAPLGTSCKGGAHSPAAVVYERLKSVEELLNLTTLGTLARPRARLAPKGTT